MARVDKITGRKTKKKMPRARARTGLAGVPMIGIVARRPRARAIPCGHRCVRHRLHAANRPIY